MPNETSSASSAPNCQATKMKNPETDIKEPRRVASRAEDHRLRDSVQYKREKRNTKPESFGVLEDVQQQISRYLDITT